MTLLNSDELHQALLDEHQALIVEANAEADRQRRRADLADAYTAFLAIGAFAVGILAGIAGTLIGVRLL